MLITRIYEYGNRRWFEFDRSKSLEYIEKECTVEMIGDLSGIDLSYLRIPNQPTIDWFVLEMSDKYFDNR